MYVPANDLIAANDASHEAGPARASEGSTTTAHRSARITPGVQAWARQAVPTAEEIRCADELWMRIRDRYLTRAAPPVAPWCVGVD